ncbi:hypothetical protein [Corallococcus aberystwythensis]|uniref:Uncharacterized protein n=1 Tax=Corallococcus aberystwythensis TaxID=2316722 RepID=A0A3A8QSX0_9BACT|nr:hypothetical protein [Corallococcus aberystwythensis]RKH71813.1 hypothetical protein D7W81_06975 [Corallococcus aberystwythensis]
MGSTARSIGLLIVLGSLMGCATTSSMNTDLDKGPLGSRTQMKTPLNAATGPRVEELEDPRRLLFYSFATYFRIHGRGKTRRLVDSEREQDNPLCRRTRDTPPGDCPEINDIAWSDILFDRLNQQAVRHEHGVWRAPKDPSRKDGRELWGYCVTLLDWKDVDATIAVIDELLLDYDITTDVCIVLHGIEEAEVL